RLADGGAADPELAGERCLLERLAGREAPLADGGDEALVGVLGQGHSDASAPALRVRSSELRGVTVPAPRGTLAGAARQAFVAGGGRGRGASGWQAGRVRGGAGDLHTGPYPGVHARTGAIQPLARAAVKRQVWGGCAREMLRGSALGVGARGEGRITPDGPSAQSRRRGGREGPMAAE